MSSLFQKEKKEIFLLVVSMVFGSLLFLSIDWVLYNSIEWQFLNNELVFGIMSNFTNIFENIGIVRLVLIAFLVMGAYFAPADFVDSKDIKSRNRVRVMAAVSTLAFLTGYLNIRFYDMYLYPVVGLVSIVTVVPAVSTFFKKDGADSFFKGLNQKQEGKVSYVLGTEDGPLAVSIAEEGIGIQGGTGSGKTSLCQEFVWQSVEKGMGGLIYEFEGDSKDESEDEKPQILARTALTASQHTDTNVKVAFLNFTDPSKSHQCNPLSKKYITTKTEALQICTVLMKSLEKHWIQKTDFWAKNAIHFVQACYWMLNKHKPEFCSLPHLVALVLQNHNIVLKWLVTDSEVERIIRPIISAIQENASQQVAGQISTGQLPFVILDSPEVFYTMLEDEVNLDLTNKENPTLLCIGNIPRMSEAVSPAISVILGVVKNNINRFGRIRGLFFIDELSTVFVYKLDEFINMVRKKGAVTIVTFQMFSQVILMYGKEIAYNIKTGVQNIFIGKTEDNDSAKSFVESLGKHSVNKVSIGNSGSGDKSMNVSLDNKEQIMETRDITGQKRGHFTGKISGGQPPFFSAQFDYYAGSYPEISDIPKFSDKYSMDDSDLGDEIMSNIVKSKYERVHAEIDEFLTPYRDEYERELASAKEAMSKAYAGRKDAN